MILAPAGPAAEIAGSRRRARRHRARRWPRRNGRTSRHSLSQDMPAAGFLDAAGSTRDTGAARADGPREGGGEHGRRACARASPRARSAPGSYSRELVGAARAAAAPDQGRHQGRASSGAPIEVALLVEPALERAGDARGGARVVRAAARHVSRLGRATGTCSSSEIAGRGTGWPAAAADQRFRRASPAGAGGGAACAGMAMTARAAAGPRRACGSRWRRSGDVPADKLRAALLEALRAGAHATRRGAALSQRSLAAGAQHERELAHRASSMPCCGGDFDLIAASQS